MLGTMSRTSARSRRQRLRRLGGGARPVAASHPATITRTPATVTARWAVARPMLTTTTPPLMSTTDRRAYSSWCERDSWDLFTAVRLLTPEGRRRAFAAPCVRRPSGVNHPAEVAAGVAANLGEAGSPAQWVETPNRREICGSEPAATARRATRAPDRSGGCSRWSPRQWDFDPGPG